MWGEENGAMLTTYLFKLYFRMHHFVVKFSKFSSPRAAKGELTPPNQNPADAFEQHPHRKISVQKRHTVPPCVDCRL